MRAPTETKPLCASERRASTPDAIGLPPGSPAGGGAALETLISSRGPAPVGVALRIVLDACAELQVIHTARPRGSDGSGPGHWSPSPDAIFVGSDGTAKVAGADPGEGASGPHAAQHARPGRLGYAAPEALLTGSSSPRSDVFTLGVVLWELLAGRRLFEGDDTIETTKRNAAAEVPSLRPRISTELDAVIRKALARPPEERIKTMAELALQLEVFGQGLVAPRSAVAAWVAHAPSSTPSPPSAEEVALLDVPPRPTPSAPGGVERQTAKPAAPRERPPAKPTTFARFAISALIVGVTAVAACIGLTLSG